MSQVPPPAPPASAPYPPQPGPMPPSSGLAISSLICGAMSIVMFCLWFLAIPIGIVAIILGMVAKGKIKRGEASGAGLATAGIVTGAIGVLIGIVLLISAFVFKDKLVELQQEQLNRMEQMQRDVDSMPATQP